MGYGYGYGQQGYGVQGSGYSVPPYQQVWAVF